MKGSVVGVVVLPGVKERIRLIRLEGVSEGFSGWSCVA